MAENKIFTPEFRASFARIFEPGLNDYGKKVYEVTMLIDPASLNEGQNRQRLGEMLKSVKEIHMDKFKGVGQWPEKGLPMNPIGGVKMPFRDGNTFDLDKYPDYEGMIVVRAASTEKPVGVINRHKQEITDPQDFYSGCYAVATVSAYAYGLKPNRDGVMPKAKGITFGLHNIMVLRKGEPLGGGHTPADKDFEALDVSQFAEDEPNEDVFSGVAATEDEYDALMSL